MSQVREVGSHKSLLVFPEMRICLWFRKKEGRRKGEEKRNRIGFLMEVLGGKGKELEE